MSDDLEVQKQIITMTPEGMEWEMTVPMSGYLDGGIEDWPSHIKEPIYEELQKTVAKAHADGELKPHIKTVEILQSYFDWDEDDKFFFCHVKAAARHYDVQSHKVVKSGKVVN